MALDNQMDMFKEENDMSLDNREDMFKESDMELMQEGGDTDPISGNEVPPGGTQEGVRDDIEANISEGEMVIPEDVVRYFGVDHFMKLRDEAKMGYKKMAAMGQMGNPDEASIPEDSMFNPGGMPFSVIDLEYVDDEGDDEAGDEPQFAVGGLATDVKPKVDNKHKEFVEAMQDDNFVKMMNVKPARQAMLSMLLGDANFAAGGLATVNPSTQETVPNTSFLQPTQTKNFDVNEAGVPSQVRIQPFPNTDFATPGRIRTKSSGVDSTLTGIAADPQTSLPVAGTTSPTNTGPLPKLPDFGTLTGGVSSFNFFRNVDGDIIQVPVINGRQIFDEPEGYQRFDPDNPADNPFDPDKEVAEDKPEEQEDKPKKQEDSDGLSGDEEGPDTGPPAEIDPDSILGKFLSLFSPEETIDPNVVDTSLSNINVNSVVNAAQARSSVDATEGPTSATTGNTMGPSENDGEVSFGDDTSEGGSDDGGSGAGDGDDGSGDGDVGVTGVGMMAHGGLVSRGLAARRKLKKPISKSRNGKGFARRT